MKRFWNTKWIPKRIRSNYRLTIPLVFVVIFASLGGSYLLFSSFAATPPPPQSLEARVKADGLELANAKGPSTNTTAIAKRRKADMVKLIQTDPDAAVRDAVPADTVHKLGKDTKGQVEETVTIGGMLTHSHGDEPQYDANHNITGLKDVDEQNYIIVGKDKTYLYTGKENMDKLDGAFAEIKGVRIGDQMAVSQIKQLPIPLITKGIVAKDTLGASTTTTTTTTQTTNANVLAATSTNVAHIYFGNTAREYSNPTLWGVVRFSSYTSAPDGSGNGVGTLSKEEWDVDGTPVDIENSSWDPNIRLDTTTYSQGQHTITYKSWDGFGVPASKSFIVTFGAKNVQRTALILFQFQDQATDDQLWGDGNPADNMTHDKLDNWTFSGSHSMAGYYEEMGQGHLALTGWKNPSALGDTYGIYTVPYNGANIVYPNCNFNSFHANAIQQAQAQGFDQNQYDHVILTSPTVPGCGSGYGGGIQDDVPWNYDKQPDDWIHFVGHEVGHSLGAGQHAHDWNCTDASGNRVQVSSNCTYAEYGDTYDIMGGGRVQYMNVYERGQIGLYPTSVGNTATVKTSGTYTLVPSTLPSSSLQSIRIPRSYDSSGKPVDYYYLEFRQPTPYDVFDTSFLKDYDGIQIRRGDEYANTAQGANDHGSNLIDTTPGSLTTPGTYDQGDARLPVGHSFQDAATGITIKTLSTSTTGATFSLAYGTPQCERVAPTVSLAPATAAWVKPGTTLNFTATITNNDSPACGSSNINLTSSLISGLIQTPSSTTVSLPPSGATTNVPFTLTSSTSAATGYYAFTETVKNVSSIQTGSAVGSYNVSNSSTPPTVTMTSPLNGSTLSGSVPLAATASSSIGIASVDFTVDGNVVCSDTTSPYTCDWNSTSVPNGVHILYATAHDASSLNGYSPQAIVIVSNGADITPPSIPANLSATAISSSQVSLSWSASTDNVGGSGLAGYNIVRNGTTIYQTTGTATTYGDTGLTPNTNYTYQVKARDIAGNVSGLSTSVNVTTPTQPVQDITPPTVSLTSPLSGTTVSGAVALSAAASDNTGGSGMNRVEFKVDGGLVNSDTASPYSYSWDSNTIGNGTHFISATAYDNVGNSNTSQYQITVFNCADCIPPSTPTNVTATVTSTSQINLSWTASTDNVGVTGYYIIRDGVTLPAVSGTTTTLSDTGLLPGSTHSYYVVAFDAASNNSLVSNTATATTQVVTVPDTQAPSPPSALISDVQSAYQVNLSWSPSIDNVGVARYDIYRSDNTRTPKASVSGTTTSFGDTTTLAGKTYSYYIYAYDSAGNKSLTSNKISVTTPAVSTSLGSMTGRVVGGDGKPVISGKVSYTLVSNGHSSVKSYSLNSNGNYTISGISPAKYDFTYTATGYNSVVVPQVTILGAQNNPQPDVTLHKLATISGTITGPNSSGTIIPLSNVVVSTPITLNGITSTKTYKTNNKGTYTFTSLPAGTYNLTYTLSGYITQTKQLDVQLDQTLIQDITLSK